MPRLLFSHKLDKETIFSIQTSSFKLVYGELGQSKMEEVEFNKFLVQSKILP